MPLTLFSIGGLLTLPNGGDAFGGNITNGGTATFAHFVGDVSGCTGFPSSPTPTLAAVLAAGGTDGGAGARFTGLLKIGADDGTLLTTGNSGNIFVSVNNTYAAEFRPAVGLQLSDWAGVLWTTGAVNSTGADVRVRRTGAKALTLDDGAGGAAGLTVTGDVTALSTVTASGFAAGGHAGQEATLSITDQSGTTHDFTFFGGLLTSYGTH